MEIFHELVKDNSVRNLFFGGLVTLLVMALTFVKFFKVLWNKKNRRKRRKKRRKKTKKLNELKRGFEICSKISDTSASSDSTNFTETTPPPSPPSQTPPKTLLKTTSTTKLRTFSSTSTDVNSTPKAFVTMSEPFRSSRAATLTSKKDEIMDTTVNKNLKKELTALQNEKERTEEKSSPKKDIQRSFGASIPSVNLNNAQTEEILKNENLENKNKKIVTEIDTKSWNRVSPSKKPENARQELTEKERREKEERQRRSRSYGFNPGHVDHTYDPSSWKYLPKKHRSFYHPSSSVSTSPKTYGTPCMLRTRSSYSQHNDYQNPYASRQTQYLSNYGEHGRVFPDPRRNSLVADPRVPTESVVGGMDRLDSMKSFRTNVSGMSRRTYRTASQYSHVSHYSYNSQSSITRACMEADDEEPNWDELRQRARRQLTEYLLQQEAAKTCNPINLDLSFLDN